MNQKNIALFIFCLSISQASLMVASQYPGYPATQGYPADQKQSRSIDEAARAALNERYATLCKEEKEKGNPHTEVAWTTAVTGIIAAALGVYGENWKLTTAGLTLAGTAGIAGVVASRNEDKRRENLRQQISQLEEKLIQ